MPDVIFVTVCTDPREAMRNGLRVYAIPIDELDLYEVDDGDLPEEDDGHA